MFKNKKLSEIREEFRPYFFDKKEANRVIRFFEKELTHQIGDKAGQKFVLQKWQKRILRHFFGWKFKSTHARKYKTLYLEVPRKNGKSILAAGLGLYLLDADREPAARVACFAKNEEQAMESVFNVAKEMVNSNPKLSKRIKAFKRTLVVYESASNFQLFSGSRRGKHGKNLSAVIGDEVHEWEDREVMDALRTSMVARAQPVEIYLTTAGYDRNTVWGEFRDYCEKLDEKIIKDPSFMGVIYCADDKDDWTDPKVWAKANPNLGISVREEFLKAECEKAQRVISYQNTFKRLHLNIRTTQDSRWISSELWNSCAAKFSEADLYGQECLIGIDLGSVSDITAVVLLFPQDDDVVRYRILPYFFVPKESVPRRTRDDRVEYQYWADNGWLITTEGEICDYDAIESFITDHLNTKFKIKHISLDRWNALHLSTRLEKNFPVSFFEQTLKSVAPPMRELEQMLIGKQILHNDHLVMNWMIKNVAVIVDSNKNKKPDKEKSKEKIDGLTALVNALGRAIVMTEDESSVYEERGFLSL